MCTFSGICHEVLYYDIQSTLALPSLILLSISKLGDIGLTHFSVDGECLTDSRPLLSFFPFLGSDGIPAARGGTACALSVIMPLPPPSSPRPSPAESFSRSDYL